MIALSLPAAAALVARAIERRNSIPILSNMLIESDGKAVRLTATDLDDEITVAVPCKATEFKTSAEGNRFRDIVARLDGVPGVHLDGKKLVIGEGPTFTLSTLAVDGGEFPRVAAVDPTTTFDLPAAQFLADLDALSPAICTEETRYYLNGVNIETRECKLSLAATDGHRLHLIEREVPTGAEALQQSIVRRRTVALIRATIEALPDVESVHLAFNRSKARFEIGPVTITAKLIDGTYPDIRRVIPADAKGSLIAQASDLLQLAEATKLVSSEKSRAIKFDFGNQLVSGKDSSGHEMSAALPGKSEGSPPDSIGFNASYFSTICERFAGQEMTMAMSDYSGPVLMTASDNPLTCVLMPMRL